jgi:hypothetical protein
MGIVGSLHPGQLELPRNRIPYVMKMRNFVLIAACISVLTIAPICCVGAIYVASLLSPSLGGVLPVWGPHFPENTFADYPGLELCSHDHGETFRSITIFDEARVSGDYECEIGELPRFNLAALEEYRDRIEAISNCRARLQGTDCRFGNASFEFRETGVKISVREVLGGDDPTKTVAIYFRGELVTLPVAVIAMKHYWGEPEKVYKH